MPLPLPAFVTPSAPRPMRLFWIEPVAVEPLIPTPLLAMMTLRSASAPPMVLFDASEMPLLLPLMRLFFTISLLPRLEPQLQRREEIWRRYDEAFASFPITCPAPAEPNTRHARHLYTILVEQDRCGKTRDQVMRELHERRVGTGVHYTALHLHPYYRERFGYREGQFPNTERIGRSTLSLPLSAKLTDEDANDVIAAVHDVLQG